MPPRRCPDKPAYHVAPKSGWTNDPNGLVWSASDGRFHAFYQHVPGSPAWAWGALSWGHASSADLAAWRHEPLALCPSPGDHDAAGCWSGCCVPPPGVVEGPKSFTLLYTGVHLRAGPHARDPGRHPPLPLDTDVGLEQHECQLAAVCEDDDRGGLTAWRKVERPIIPHAPSGLAPSLHGFRDPFIFERWDDGLGQPWRLVLGSGRAGRGCLLAYKSHAADPAAPAWEFEGVLASGVGLAVTAPEVGVGSDQAPPSASSSASPVDAVDVGEVWECPFIARLADDRGRPWTLVCVSPYPHTHARGRPTNPPISWLVEGDGSFDLAAVGPLRLDLGDTLYAPTVCAGAPNTPAGRAAVGVAADGGDGDKPPPPPVVLMGWVQDLRPVAAAPAHGEDASESPAARANYAGCLSLPRVLSVRAGEGEGGGGRPRLFQAPAPGVAALRLPPPPGTPAWPADTVLQPGVAPVPIPGVDGDAVDLEVTFVRTTDGNAASGSAGLWLRRGLAAAGDAPGVLTPTAVALVVDWATARLEVVHFTRVHGDDGTGAPDWAAAVRRAGGACAAVAAGRVELRVLVDHSVVEAFAVDSGEALATRVYGCGRGAERRWEVFASGEAAAVPAAAGWKMRSGWEEGG